MTMRRGKTTTRGLSITPSLLRRAKIKAEQEGRTFSGHVTYLLQRDLGKTGRVNKDAPNEVPASAVAGS